MSIEDSLREQLIKQFPADVMVLMDEFKKEFYACPTCKRVVAMSNAKCMACDQALKWDNVKHKEMETFGKKIATLTFEVPADFTKSYCRKCPISFIAKQDKENMYECPLGMRNNCPLEID